MERNNIKYTNAALDQLEKFKQDQVNKLEELIVENKRFPGVDFIEITASDIQEEAKKFTYRKPALKSELRYLVIYLYLFSGVGLMLFGFLYQDIIDIWQNQPRQGLFILTGFTMALMSGFLFVYIRHREKIKLEEYKRYADSLNRNEKVIIDEMLKKISDDWNQPTILILSATYEWPSGQEDVTEKLKELVSKGIYTIIVDPSTFGIRDPAQGIVKTLKIHCKINGTEKEFIHKDGERFHIR